MLSPPRWTVKGPPESPEQAPRPFVPVTQMFESWMTPGNRNVHAALVMMLSYTNLKTSEAWPIESLNTPQPEMTPSSPLKAGFPTGRVAGWMTFGINTTGEGNWTKATSYRISDGVQFSYIKMFCGITAIRLWLGSFAFVIKWAPKTIVPCDAPSTQWAAVSTRVVLINVPPVIEVVK